MVSGHDIPQTRVVDWRMAGVSGRPVWSVNGVCGRPVDRPSPLAPEDGRGELRRGVEQRRETLLMASLIGIYFTNIRQ